MSDIIIPALGRFSFYDDRNYKSLANDRSTSHMRGYTGRDYSRHPFGSMPWRNIAFPIIHRSEWPERIKEAHAKKTFPIYHQQLQKVPIKNQRQTNYCWINAVVGALQSVRAGSGFPTVALSSASAGAPGKGYKNVGGWTGEAIGYIDEYGLAPESMWPNDAIDRNYFRETREVAKQYKVGQWMELRPKSIDEVVTCLLYGFPVCVGLLWWGHAVFYSGLTWDGRLGVIVDNSWGDQWENNGRTVLDEQKATPDEANCVTTPMLAGDNTPRRLYSDVLATAG